MIGFSGHRDLGDSTTVAAGVQAALDLLAGHHAPVAAVSSAASGSDTLFLEEVARRGIPFFLLLPFHRTRFEQDFVHDDWRRVEALLDQALDVQDLGDTDAPEEAYLETGVRVVDRADVMVAVWDGKPARGVGGTAEVVDYARDLGRPLIIVDPSTGSLTSERLERLRGAAGPAGWDGRPRQAVEQEFELLDQEAVRQQPKARQYFLYGILAHLLASIFAVLAFLESGIPVEALIFGEIVCLGLALAATWQHRRPHYTWVASRIGAELCRSFLAVWHLRGRARPVSAVGGSAVERLYRSLCLAWYLDRPEQQDFATARDHYLRQRVLNQMGYFERNLRKAGPTFTWLQGAAYVATLLAIATAGLALASAESVRPLMKMSAAILPLVSAALLSVVVSQDYLRRKLRYSEVAAWLAAVARRLEATRTWHGLTRIAVETEEQLLHELLEWHSVARFAGEPH